MQKFTIILLMVFLNLEKFGLGDCQEANTPCGRVWSEFGKITFIYSPGTRESGPIRCHWTIGSENPDDRVEIKFTNLVIDHNKQQVLDVIEPGSAKKIQNKGQIILTSSNPVNISFESFNRSNFYSIEAHYKIIKPCGNQNLTDSYGTFVSLHKQDVNCLWNILPKSQNPNETFDAILIRLSRRYTYCQNQNETYFFSDGIRKNFTLSCTIGESLPAFREFHMFTPKISVKLTKFPPFEGAYEISYEASKFKKYGENCTKSDLCDPYKMLKCSEQGLCSCFKESMLFSYIEEECLATYKNPCNFPMGVVEAEATIAKCQKDNQCLQGVCECDPDIFFENKFGQCQPKFKYSENCTSNQECDQNNFLSCIDGKCGCNSNHQIIDSKNTTCLVKLGHHCDNGSSCLENGHCLLYKESNITACSCSDGFAESSGGRCHNDYGQNCSSSSPCADLQFECISNNANLNKVCRCKGAFNEYNLGLKKCLSPNGGECSPGKEDCLENMVCEYKSIFKSSRCQCPTNKGFTLENGKCFPTNGSKCSRNSACYSNLYCRNDVCLCRELEEYSKSKNKCFFVCNDNSGCPNLETKCIKNFDTFAEFGHDLGRCDEAQNFQSSKSTNLSPTYFTFFTLLAIYLFI